jgi:hypothetical protein
MTLRTFTVHDSAGQHELVIDLVRAYNLGFTIRDEEKMRRHLEECHRVGVPIPVVTRPPLVMPISTWAWVTDDVISVQRERTSGEVEIATVVDADGTIYVGVGSDHTDRALECIDIPWSKQVAPNVIAPTLWPWDEVAGHWDDVLMESWVVDGGQRVKYQEASVAEFWTPAEMLQGVRESVVEPGGAIAFLSGTVVSIEETLRFAEEWTLRLIDPVLDRTIEHTYRVEVLAGEVLNDGSVNGIVAGADVAATPN